MSSCGPVGWFLVKDNEASLLPVFPRMGFSRVDCVVYIVAMLITIMVILIYVCSSKT